MYPFTHYTNQMYPCGDSTKSRANPIIINLHRHQEIPFWNALRVCGQVINGHEQWSSHKIFFLITLKQNNNKNTHCQWKTSKNSLHLCLWRRNCQRWSKDRIPEVSTKLYHQVIGHTFTIFILSPQGIRIHLISTFSWGPFQLSICSVFWFRCGLGNAPSLSSFEVPIWQQFTSFLIILLSFCYDVFLRTSSFYLQENHFLMQSRTCRPDLFLISAANLLIFT